MNGIDRVSAQNISRAYAQTTDATQSAAPAGRVDRAQGQHQPHSHRPADSVSLSADAKSLAAARDAVTHAPDVREQKVADIKQQISDGTYHVPARLLARKMLDQQSA